MIRNFIRALYCLFALVLICLPGWQNAQTLWLVSQPNSQFEETRGTIAAVIKHSNPLDDGADWERVPFLAEVKFDYTVDGAAFSSNTFSADCTWCTPKDVFTTTGYRPSQLAVGTPVAVFSKRGHPQTAYLKLASKRDVLSQFGMTFLWLILGPAFVLWHGYMMTRRESAGE